MADQLIGSAVNWDCNNRHVQPPASIRDDGVTVQANTVLIAVGAPTLNKGTGGSSMVLGQPVRTLMAGATVDLQGIAYPVGNAETIQISQQKVLNQFFEIGSKRRYFIPGRVTNGLNLSRVYMDGPSLLKVMWAYYQENVDAAPNSNAGIASWKNLGGRTIDNQPGRGPMWLNLASELFDRPVGILLYFKNTLQENMGAVYLENCNISTHQFGISASSTIFAESISMQFDAVLPVNIFQG